MLSFPSLPSHQQVINTPPWLSDFNKDLCIIHYLLKNLSENVLVLSVTTETDAWPHG